MASSADLVTIGAMAFSAAARSVEGKVRKVNEDSFLCVPGAYVVADGMGGHNAGDVASRLTIEAVVAWWGDGRPDITSLPGVVESANAAVHDRSGVDGQAGMGSTMVGAFVIRNGDGDSLVVVNVGDSRCYLLHDGQLEQLTKDHSYVQELVDQGHLSEADAAVHPERNVVTRAIGVQPVVAGDFFVVPSLAEYRLLLCSDGVSGEVPIDRLRSILVDATDPETAAGDVITAVMEGRARDNATAIVVDVTRVDLVEDPDVTGPRVRPVTPSGSITADDTQPRPIETAVIATVPMAEPRRPQQIAVTQMIDEVPDGRSN